MSFSVNFMDSLINNNTLGVIIITDSTYMCNMLRTERYIDLHSVIEALHKQKLLRNKNLLLFYGNLTMR